MSRAVSVRCCFLLKHVYPDITNSLMTFSLKTQSQEQYLVKSSVHSDDMVLHTSRVHRNLP